LRLLRSLCGTNNYIQQHFYIIEPQPLASKIFSLRVTTFPLIIFVSNTGFAGSVADSYFITQPATVSVNIGCDTSFTIAKIKALLAESAYA
jgi:hypothetical protein